MVVLVVWIGSVFSIMLTNLRSNLFFKILKRNTSDSLNYKKRMFSQTHYQNVIKFKPPLICKSRSFLHQVISRWLGCQFVVEPSVICFHMSCWGHLRQWQVFHNYSPHVPNDLFFIYFFITRNKQFHSFGCVFPF